MSDFRPYYELTMREEGGKHPIVWADSIDQSAATKEGQPFVGAPKKPLFDRFTYQAAICANPIPGSIWDAMRKSGVGPTVKSPDRRTGIILFDGDKIIGSNTDVGSTNPPRFSIYLDPEYRDQKIGQWLLVAWWLEFPRSLTKDPLLVMNQYAARATLAARAKYLKFCTDAGKVIPQRVLDAVEEDRAWALAKIQAAEDAYKAKTQNET